MSAEQAEAETHQVPSDYRERVTTSLSDDEYNFLNYFAYCLYPPLYIAGPIITFNDFVWQVRPHPPLPLPELSELTGNSCDNPLPSLDEISSPTSFASYSAS